MMKRGNQSLFWIIVFFTFLYFCAYLSRKTYAILLPEIISYTELSKEELSIPLTTLFIACAITQLFAGIIVDRSKPKYIITITLIICGLCNFLVPILCSNIIIMSIIWCINGISESFVWPSIIKICSTFTTGKKLASGITVIIIGGYLGQCFLCLAGFLFIEFSNFVYLFYLAGLLAVTMGIANLFIKERREVQIVAKSIEVNNKSNNQFVSLLIITIFGIVILTGALRDSVESWAPVFLNQAFYIPEKYAILSSAILPVFTIVFTELNLILYKHVFKSPITLVFALSIFTTILISSLIAVANYSETFTYLLLALAYGSSCGIACAVISFVPIYYQKTGKVATIASLLNACTFVGSAIATYLIAYIANEDVFGWTGAVIFWLIISILSTILIGLIIRPWRKKHPQIISN